MAGDIPRFIDLFYLKRLTVTLLLSTAHRFEL